MNAGEFTELLNRAVSRGIKEGINEGKMDFAQMVGALDMQKSGVISFVQDLAKAQHKAQQPTIIPARNITPSGMPGL